MSAAVSVARDVTGGIAEGIQDVGSSLGSAASSAIAGVRGVTGGVYDAIGAAAQKVGNTVEAVLNNPKALAAVAVSIAFPGAAPALGEWILGAELAATVGAAGTAAVGNMCLNTAMNGGDVGQAVKTTALQYVGNVGAEKMTQIVKNADIVPEAFAKNVGATTTYAAIQAAQGKDPTVALLTGGANACAQVIAQEIPGFAELPKSTQDQITRATASAIQGNTTGVLNAAIDFGVTFAKDEFKAYKEANESGFGYDADSYRDAKTIGILNPEDYRYAKTIGAENPYDLQVGRSVGAKDFSDLSLAKTIGATDAVDLNIAKEFGLGDKTTMGQYSDFLRRGDEKSSEITIGAEDGTEMVVDNEGNLRSYTYRGVDGSPVDITNEVANVASRANGYQLRGDDGSILTVNADGTVSATEAPDDSGFLGSVKPSTYAKLLGVAQQNRATTQATERGGVNQATQQAAERMRSSPLNRTGYQITGQDVAGILPLFLGQDTYYSPTTAEGEESDSGLAQVELPQDSDLNYLADMGGRPNYLGALDQGSATQGAQVEPGKDAGAVTRGAVFGPPVGTGGGGAGFDKYYSSGPMQEFGGGAGYGQSSINDIYKILQSSPSGSQPGVASDVLQSLRTAGLEDQSDAETQRLLAAQGPVAVGRPVPPKAPAMTPQMSTLPAGQPALPALANTAMPSATPSVDPLKQLQEYASLAGAAGGETINSLLKYILASGSKPKGTEAYKDMFGNIRTR